MNEEQKSQTINEEAGLPDNWLPVDAPPIIPSFTPISDGSSRYLQGSLPPSFQHDVSFTGTQYKSDRTPSLSLMPLGIQGNAVTNAAIQSTAAQTPSAVPSTVPTKLVSLSIPNIFTPILQTEDSNGLLAFTLATEIQNTVFAASGGTALDQVDTVSTGFGGSPASLSATPSHSGDLALVITAQDVNTGTAFNPGAPWSFVIGAGTNVNIYNQVISGTASVTAAGPTGSAPAWDGVLMLLGAKLGFTPVVVHSSTVISGAFGTQTNLAIGFTPTAGNTLLFIFSTGSANSSNPSPILSFFSDSQGDVFTILAQASNSSNSGTKTVVVGARAVAGGVTTVSFVLNPSAVNGSVIALEISNLSSIATIPSFRFLVPADIPPTVLSSNNASGGVTGILGRGNLPAQVAYTDAANNFIAAQTFTPSSTSVIPISIVGNSGGASQFNTFGNLYVRTDLFQGGLISPWTNYSLVVGGISTFPALGVSLAAGATGDAIDTFAPGSTTVKNFSVASTGKITNYNGIATVSDGVPAEYATVDLTAQAANIGVTTLYAVPSTGAGMYRVSAYVVMTTAASVSSTLPTVQIVYTDADANVSVTMDATPVSGSAGLGQTGALTANSVGSAASGVIAVNVKASTTIQYQTVNYASNAAGMQYAIHLKLEAL